MTEVTEASAAGAAGAAADTRGLAGRSARALGWSWAGAVARALLTLVVQIVIARLLGPTAFGEAMAVLLVIGMASLLAEAGLSAALIQRQPLRPGDPGLALGWALSVSLGIGVLLALLAAPLARWLGGPQLEPLVMAAVLIVPLQAVATLPVALLQRRFEVKTLQAQQLLAYALAYGAFGISLAFAGAGAWSLLLAYAGNAVLVLALAAWATRDAGWRPRWWPLDRAPAAPLLAYGLRTAMSNLVNWCIESLDRLVVSAAMGPAALGSYSVAANLARAPVTLLVSSAQPVAFAAAAQLQDERARIARGYLAMISLALLLAAPLFVFLAWHAPALVKLLYGPAWSAAAAPFAALCLGVPFFVMLALGGPLLRGVDAVGSEMGAHAAALLLLALALWLVLGLGLDQPLWCVAAAVGVATVLRAAGIAWALSRKLGLPWSEPWRCWLGGLVLALLVLGVSVLMHMVLGEGMLALAASALLGLPLTVLALKAAGTQLLGPAACLALSNRRSDSRLAAWLCRWAHLA